MAEMRWHAIVGGRPIAGLCENVCTSAFFLDHVVHSNYAGKAVLVFGGVCVRYYEHASPMLRDVGLANAVLMLVGHWWYTAFWGSSSAIAAFVAPDARLGGSPAQQHVLHTFGVCPHVILVAAVGYYSVFATLFAYSCTLETAGSLSLAYALAASVWHAWIALAMAWAAVLGGLLNRRTNATRQELQKLVGVRPTTASELPLAQEAAFTVPVQRPMVAAAVQSAVSNGLFRFDQLSVHVQN